MGQWIDLEIFFEVGAMKDPAKSESANANSSRQACDADNSSANFDSSKESQINIVEPLSDSGLQANNNGLEISLTNRRDFLKAATLTTAGGLLSTTLAPLKASAAFIGFWKKKTATAAGTLWAWGGDQRNVRDGFDR